MSRVLSLVQKLLYNFNISRRVLFNVTYYVLTYNCYLVLHTPPVSQ